MKGSALHNFHNHPLMMTLHYTCMASMILMVWDPNLAVWGANFLQHIVQGFGQLPAIFNAYGGKTAATAMAPAASVTPVPSMPGMDMGMSDMHHGI